MVSVHPNPPPDPPDVPIADSGVLDVFRTNSAFALEASHMVSGGWGHPAGERKQATLGAGEVMFVGL
jgi:hypothetical protein